MEFVFSIFNFLFKSSKKWLIFLEKEDEKLKKIESWSFVALLIIILLGYIFHFFTNHYSSVFRIYWGLISLVFLLLLFSSNRLSFTSVRQFLSKGIWSFFLWILFILYGVVLILSVGNFEISSFFLYIGVMIFLVIGWLFFSILCDTSVAIIVNTFLSTILGILLFIKPTILSIINIIGFPSTLKMLIGKLDIMSTETFVSVVLDLLIFPVFVMFAAGSLISMVKEYWEKKYNSKSNN